MKKYEFFEHTADAKFRAYGKSVDEAFSNAALAMTSIMTGKEKIKPKIKKSIKIAGEDLKALLYSFLEEFLFFLDTENFLISEVKTKISKKGGTYLLEAEALGDKASNYKTHGDVKAVTYNAMKISKKPVYVQVVVDI
jgi:SHS2 domain-containing protein